jgi:hypothetical protein
MPSANAVKRRKEIELFYFERVQALLDCWPAGTVDSMGEEPDIVVDRPEGRYGVEVTEMLRGEVRAVEETHRLICEKAHTLFQRRIDIDCLRVQVSFREHPPIRLRKQDQDAVAIALVEIVASRIRARSEGAFRIHLEEGRDFHSDVILSIWLDYLPGVSDSLWTPIGGWWVPVASSDLVQREIDRKQGKLAAYRTCVADVWLLVVLQGFSGAASWSVDDAVLTHRFKTNFNGVVLLDYAMNKAHRLLIV